jgi:transmembrane sensor
MSEAADIEAQAAAWIARCDARGGDQAPGLAAWLIADPRHRAAYVRLAHAWERSRRLGRLRPADRDIDPDLLAPSRPRDSRARLRGRTSASGGRIAGPPPARRAPARRSRTMRLTATAAGIAAAVILALWSLPPSSAAQTYRTGPGGLSRVFLSDGSAVTMNANTELQVRFTAARRSLTLVRGEAHFSVTHDTHRPFEVHARERVVVAVGTAFDVRLDRGHGVEVTVTEGRVALLDERASVPRPQPGEPSLQTVSAGQDALLTTRGVAVQRIDSAGISRRLAWERRELSFEGQTLGQAVAEFERYTNRRIVIDDPSIAALEIGGSFSALDVQSFIAALNRAFGISSRLTPHGTIHLYRVGTVTAARLQR